MSLVNILRTAEAPLVIRRKGARGELPVDFAEKVEILVLLSRDPEPEIQAEACQTFVALEPQALADLLAKPEASAEVLEYAAHTLSPNQALAVCALRANPALRPELRVLVETYGLSARASEPSTTLPPTALGDMPTAEAAGHTNETVLQRLARMTAPEKIKCALTGSQEERMILIRDANKTVARSVLQSPKISDAEIEAFAAMAGLSEEVLRLIAKNRGFMKNYAVSRALINNPHAPLDVTLPLITRLHDRDLKMLSMNKNVADVLRTTAAKLVRTRTESRTMTYHKH